jgi:hypothetical protein
MVMRADAARSSRLSLEKAGKRQFTGPRPSAK